MATMLKRTRQKCFALQIFPVSFFLNTGLEKRPHQQSQQYSNFLLHPIHEQNDILHSNVQSSRVKTDLKAKEINWLIGKKIQLVYRKQNTSLQSGDQTHLDLRSRTLGMCQQVQHSNCADSTIKNSQDHNKCSLVCDKPYPPY